MSCRSLWGLLVLVAVCCLLAGCGSTSSTQTTTTSTSTAAAHGYSTPYGPSANPPGWGYPPSCSSGKDCTVAPPPSSSLAGTRRMYDTITLSAFPSSLFAAAGYTSGWWVTFPLIRARWPKTHTVSIAVSASATGACLDIEPGDASPSQAASWYRSERKAGVKRPCLYSSYWEFVYEVRPALSEARVKRADVYEWDADYLGCPRLDKSFDATQCTDHALGRNLDESVVTSGFLSIATPPYKPLPSHARLGAELRTLDAELGSYSKRDREGHNCAKPPYHHAYPTARWDGECSRWAARTREIKRALGTK